MAKSEMLKKQKIEGVDPAVVSVQEADSDSDSASDLEPRSGEEMDYSSSSEEDPDVVAQRHKQQIASVAEEALKHYNYNHQGVEYVLVDFILINDVLIPSGMFTHSMFTATNLVSSSSSSMESSPPTPKTVVIDNNDGSSSSSMERTPPTPKMVIVNNDSGSSSSSSIPIESTPPTPPKTELFFAETALYEGQGMKLTVHSCVIIDPSGPVPPKIGCHYCSTFTKQPFYHPPEEQLEFVPKPSRRICSCTPQLLINIDKHGQPIFDCDSSCKHGFLLERRVGDVFTVVGGNSDCLEERPELERRA
ncbi:unnamed protein product [Linum tenue]|uniref:Uncharacterized protein n=1 Tax=Linum tenue TaxID=586396 RepID=A0AAV0KYB4_9ROSI|nr:unnamed protein product [Linum tenue]CAI0426330.1 unnamed protein product [Linum tenue]